MREGRRLGFIPAIDGLRALAIVMVMAHHAQIPHERLDGARSSVDLFFVISGFLITALVTNEFDKAGRIDLKSFYRRRAYRLLPAVVVFFVVIALYAIADAVLFDGPSPRPTLLALLYAATYVSNWAWAFGADLPIHFSHLWTLAMEEQFYFIAPISLAFLLPRFRRTTIIRGVLVVGAIGVAWRCFLVMQGADKLRTRFGLDTHADALVIGCVLGLLFASGMAAKLFEPSRVKSRVGLGVVLLFVGMTFANLDDWFGQEAWAPAVWAVMGAIAVVSVIGQTEGLHVRVLESPVVQRIGKVSYGLYLWHTPVQIYSGRIIGFDQPLWLRTLVAWTLAYALAELSWRLIEAPAQHLRQRRERTRVLDLTGRTHETSGLLV